MSKITVTRSGDKFTSTTEAEFTAKGFKVEARSVDSSLDLIFTAARAYKCTVDEIGFVSCFMDSALNQFYQTETDLSYADVKGIAAIFGMMRDSIDVMSTDCFDEGQIIQNFKGCDGP